MFGVKRPDMRTLARSFKHYFTTNKDRISLRTIRYKNLGTFDRGRKSTRSFKLSFDIDAHKNQTNRT